MLKPLVSSVNDTKPGGTVGVGRGSKAGVASPALQPTTVSVRTIANGHMSNLSIATFWRVQSYQSARYSQGIWLSRIPLIAARETIARPIWAGAFSYGIVAQGSGSSRRDGRPPPRHRPILSAAWTYAFRRLLYRCDSSLYGSIDGRDIIRSITRYYSVLLVVPGLIVSMGGMLHALI